MCLFNQISRKRPPQKAAATKAGKGYATILRMKAEIIAVGSELLTPDRIDTNSLFLTEELAAS